MHSRSLSSYSNLILRRLTPRLNSIEPVVTLKYRIITSATLVVIFMKRKQTSWSVVVLSTDVGDKVFGNLSSSKIPHEYFRSWAKLCEWISFSFRGLNILKSAQLKSSSTKWLLHDFRMAYTSRFQVNRSSIVLFCLLIFSTFGIFKDNREFSFMNLGTMTE